MKKRSLVFVLIAMTAAITGGFGCSSKDKTPYDPFSAAQGACIFALNSVLNDPDSAKFDATSSWYIEERKNGTILVQPTLRARNAFGAYVHATWDCIVKPEGENIRVLSLKQIRP